MSCRWYARSQGVDSEHVAFLLTMLTGCRGEDWVTVVLKDAETSPSPRESSFTRDIELAPGLAPLL